MYNTGLFKFTRFSDKYGSLIPIECGLNTPFEVKRVYYIYDVAEHVRRGFHSHNKLHQMLICVKGSVKILLKTPYEEQEVLLDDPAKGLYIGPMIWREMFDFSSDAVLLVLASNHYDESDYIRNYDKYLQEATAFFVDEK